MSQDERTSTDPNGVPVYRKVQNTGTLDGQTFSVVVLSVDRMSLLAAPPAINPPVVVAACKASELARAEYKTIAQQEADANRAAPAAKQYTRRRIAHPLFRNITLEQAALSLALSSSP